MLKSSKNFGKRAVDYTDVPFYLYTFRRMYLTEEEKNWFKSKLGKRLENCVPFRIKFREIGTKKYPLLIAKCESGTKGIHLNKQIWNDFLSFRRKLEIRKAIEILNGLRPEELNEKEREALRFLLKKLTRGRNR